MATQERLMKSLDALKSILSSNLTSDSALRKKDKILHCNIIGDAMCNSSVKVATNFPNLLSFSIEILLQLCDDPESDVRMIADESLNRIIRAMMNGNIIKVQLELHKEIKKNGSARSLRAALWRFAQLCHMIRPHKGKPYVNNLIPCITKITERSEESLHETLANSLQKIMDALGSFTTDNDVKCLLKAFLQNISSSSAVLRRTATNCIITVCIKCRKPHIFITYILNTLLDLLIPVTSEHSTPLILGVLGCLRNILPHVRQTSGDQELKGSFGVKRNLNDNTLSPSRMIQVYELSLHYANHSDHNVVNAALETLNTLLQNAPAELINTLISPEGIGKSRITTSDSSCMKLKRRSLSQISVATTRTLADESTLVDNEVTEIRTDIEKWIESSKLPSDQIISVSATSESVTSENKADNNTTDNCEYSNIYIGTIDQSFEVIDASNTDKIIDDIDVSDGIPSEKSSPKMINDKSALDENTVIYQDTDIGHFTDSSVPLEYCTRFITKSFLLTGYPNNLIPDKTVRISVKSLALTCISSVVQHYPKALAMYLDKNSAKVDDSAKSEKILSNQRISDILLFSKHTDPQLRGNVSSLVGNFIRAVLLHSKRDFDKWLEDNVEVDVRESFQLKTLMQLLVKSLQDESSTCSRLSLIGIGNCMTDVIESANSLAILPVLNLLPSLVKNPYWLVKVKLVEVVCEIPFITIHFVTGTCEFQDKIIHNVLFTLLKDEDQRVRHAAAIAVVKIISNLYNERDFPNQGITTTRAIHYKYKYLSNIFNTSLDENIFESRILKNLPKPYSSIGSKANYAAEQSLSRMISYLSQNLLNSSSKYATYGSSEALYLLANEYETTKFYEAWSCSRLKSSKNNSTEIFQRSFSQNTDSPDRNIDTNFSSACGLLNTCVALLTTTTVSQEITCHQWLLSLAGNVFSGIAVYNLRNSDEIYPDATNKQFWDMYADKHIAEITEQFLHHIVRLLNIFCHIIDETVPTLPPTKPVLSNLPSATNLSPIKRRSKGDINEKNKSGSSVRSSEKDDKSDKKNENSKFTAMGYFANLPHYMKFYDILRMAYTNYKITLDSDASEKFLQLLKTTLGTLSQVLEMSSVSEMGRIAEELLFYLRSTVILESTASIHCVLQLLKCLFGTNLCFQIINDIGLRNKDQENLDHKFGMFYNIFQSLYMNLTESIKVIKNANKLDKDSDTVVMGYLHRKDRNQSVNFKSLSRTADKTALANYIRLFEPMVIKALKQYTITSDVRLQCIVLQLLSHLVQLRVNYCLLDSDQIFIGYVLKQFEFIEEGQIHLAEELIPRIFQFLVHLSYEKQHSKSIMNIPKIIHLCDGLMASGQSPLTHFIPAIIPVIEDIFIFRNQNNTVTDIKELETTRDVLFSMLLRLVEYPQVIHLLALVVNESKYSNDNGERWNRWSKQISEILLPVLTQHRVRIENSESQIALNNLIIALNPIVFKPISGVLKVLFSEPPSEQCPTVKSVNYWLGMILTFSMTISQVKEDVLLLRISEVQSEFCSRCVFNVTTNIVTPDPLNVSVPTHLLDGVPPAEIFARFIFRIIEITTEKCLVIFNEEGHCDNYIFEQFSVYLMYCVHMFQSGSHYKIANSAIRLISSNSSVKEPIEFKNINSIMLKLAPFCPILTLEWCSLLNLLNYNERSFWSSILQTPKCDGIVHLTPGSVKTSLKSNCINLEIVKIGGTILYCDYLLENINDAEQLTWLLVNHIEYIIRISDEVPVAELISLVHRNSAASGLFIQAIGARCQDISEPCFIDKLLSSLENTHPSQYGALLLLIIPRLLNCRQLALSRLASSLASQKIEVLLTLSIEEVQEQLPKDDLIIIINSLLKAKIIKKHETLVSLLNRLGSKCYDLSPVEFDQRRNLNPENIKNIVINKVWYLSQVKIHCTQSTYSGKESAELLSKLDFEDMLSVMSNVDFNNSILKDCIILVKKAVKNNFSDDENPLLRATVITLLNHIGYIKSLIPKPHQVYKASGRETTPSEHKYVKRLCELFSDNSFWLAFCKIIPTVTCYLESLPDLPRTKIPDNHFEDFAKFGVLCLESIIFQINNQKALTPNFMDIVLSCVTVIFKQHNFCSILGLDSYCSWLCSAVNAVYFSVEFLLLNHEPLPSLPTHGLKATLENMETLSAGHACYQLSVMIAWVKQIQNSLVHIPDFLLKPIKSIIISLSRLPLVNSYVLTPPNAWQQGWPIELSGTYNTHVPPLPIEFLQEIDVLEEFIFRITLLGWTSRQQFEETWMCFLSVLSANPTEDSMPDEIASLVHSASLSVQAITALLLQTLLIPVPGDPHISRLIHVCRDSDIDCSSIAMKKLHLAHESLYWKYQEYAKITSAQYPLTNIFKKSNFERVHNHGYGYSQVSIEYLWISAKIAEITREDSLAVQAFLKRQKYLNESGLDLHSCLQFLLDLYTQWIKPQNNTPLRLLHEVVKSILVLSDIFTEKSQYTWMLDVCLNLSKSHPVEDEILHQYLVVGICKATAVLTPDLETYELVKKMVATSLKSGFLPSKISSLHGILYLLQSSVIGNTVIGGLSEETQLVHPVAIDYVQYHINANANILNQSEEHQLIMWALAFFMLENVEEQITETDIVPSVLQVALTLLSQHSLPISIHNALMQGLERLIVKKCITGKVAEQVTKIALDKLRNSNSNYTLPGLQLLLTCMYMDSQEQLNANNPDGVVQTDPELFVQMIEKVSAVFDRIKKSCPYEVDMLCSVLPNILNDFFPPSEILTKVIGEFLSPQQPHPKILSGVVFLVFERACERSQLLLLQDWVVCSLSNFTQSLPVGMATWCLTCFFISASTNSWLRSLFPYIQSRIGRYEYEDKKMLCIAGADFYWSLINDNQRQSFVETFNKVKDIPGTPFKDLITCL